ncbi:MAG: SRPBCC family protein [Pseudomonadota bacterium]
MTLPEYHYVTVIAAAPEQVWKALTTAEFTRQYWHSTRVQSDWREGSAIEFKVDTPDGEAVGCCGEILLADHPRELSYTWQFPGNPEVADEPPSRVTFVLEPLGDHTRLSITHDRFTTDSKMLALVRDGWPLVLAGLKTLLETGKAVDFSVH